MTAVADVTLELGVLLLEEGLLDEEAFERVIARRRAGEGFEEAAYRLGVLQEREVLRALADRYDLGYTDGLEASQIDGSVVRLLDRDRAERHGAIPIFRIDDELFVAVSSPTEEAVIDHLRRSTGLTVTPVLSSRAAIRAAIEGFYKAVDDIDVDVDVAEKEVPVAVEEDAYDLDEVEGDGDASTAVRIVHLVIRQAIRDRVSDIHIEPAEDGVHVRFRKAGILEDVKHLPRSVLAEVVSRVKVMAELDIAEKRLPQDGRIQIRAEGREVDLRVSSCPTVCGEKIVMRLLDKQNALLGLRDLGFLEHVYARFDALIRRPYGIILITGPTGSGKTTTLYAALNTINSRAKNIMTFEDPVEYRLAGINQTQVQAKAGLTFASGLRASLRQDPDILMVGEIRDFETAEVAVHASLTGHLVLSTLHTNDSTSTVARIVDMGVEPFLIASSLAGAVAQRLVRLLCPACKEPYTAPEALKEELGLAGVRESITFWREKGCRHCRGTGYRGQRALFEIMVVDEEISQQILARAPASSLRATARRHGMLTLREDGIAKAMQGMTSVSEILRVTTSAGQE